MIRTKLATQDDERLRWYFVLGYAILLILFGLTFDHPKTIIEGLINIVSERDTLITDYFVIGGIGAAFTNAGLVTLILAIIVKLSKVPFNGATIAALFLVAGFSLFGKNILNIWPMILGVYLYSRHKKEPFSNYIYFALFGTALAPLFSEIAFMEGLVWYISIPLAFVVSVVCGFILPPLAHHFLRFHQGYNLYNVGFTAGVIGLIVLAVMESFGLRIDTRLIWFEGKNFILALYMFGYFASMIVLGLVLDHRQLFTRLKRSCKNTGQLVTDLIHLEGSSTTLINMGLLGCISTAYILIIKGDLNGPTIGGILSVAAFGCFGKNLRNTLPIFIGVAIAGLISSEFNINSESIQLAALFGTSLAPIAGEFGLIAGILAGYVHANVSVNVGVLHGGMNLYNNGFSAGFVASVFVPVIRAFRRGDDK